jgi:DNA-binding LacI/PurR family transcriptional regulator
MPGGAMKAIDSETRPIYLRIREDLLLAMEGRDFHKLPSERELCDRYGVCRPTVQKALDYFLERNLIVRRPGKGSFLKRAPAAGGATVVKSVKLLVRHDWRSWEDDTYFGLAVQGVFDAVSGHAISVGIEKFDDAQLYRLLREEDAASIWLSPEEREIGAMKTIADANRVVVSLNRTVEHPGIRYASSDHEGDGSLAASLLLKEGRRRLLYLRADSDSLISDARRRGIEKELKDSGSCEMSTFSGKDWLDSFKPLLDGILSRPVRPDGFIINNASLLQAAIEVLASRGMKHPGAFGMVSFGERPSLGTLGVPIICQQVVRLGKLAGELALGDAAGDGRILLPSRIISGHADKEELK